MTRRVQYLGGVLVIAPVWYAVSLVLVLALAAAEDNPDMTATTPWPVRAACAIALFPVRYLQDWDSPSKGVSEHVSVVYAKLGMLANGVFWGLLIVFLCRLTAKIVVKKQ